jgi:hypothetical protein
MRGALVTAVLVPLFPVPATSFAQTRKPSQEESIWAWYYDQLAEVGVRQSEKAAAICAIALDVVGIPAALTRSGTSEHTPDARDRFWATGCAAEREQREPPFFWLGRDA